MFYILCVIYIRISAFYRTVEKFVDSCGKHGQFTLCFISNSIQLEEEGRRQAWDLAESPVDHVMGKWCPGIDAQIYLTF